MNQEILQVIAQFLGRVTLQANEIDAFQACQQALQEAFDALEAQKTPNEGGPERTVKDAEVEDAEVEDAEA